MGFIDSGSKSSRLLASRRYTHNTFTTAQESFTNVLDLRGEEIYTQAQYIPSTGLPYSGSSQHGLIQQASGSNLMKYWYRHKLTPSNTNPEVWFFLSPTGSDNGIGAQLIDDNQQTSFISPKYSTSALANATTEDSTPGYGIVVYKSSTYTQSHQTGSLGSSDKVSGNDYIFDYKTGVLQFLSSAHDPASNEVVFMTAYQYVGKTLATGLDIAGDITASNMLLSGNLTLGGGADDSIEVNAEYSGSIIPDVDNVFDLGSSAKQWKDIYVNGTGYIDTFDAVSSTGVISGSILKSAGDISGSAADISGNLVVDGTGSIGKVVGDLTEIINVTVGSHDDPPTSRYVFEGEMTPNFTFEEGKTYRFDQSDSTNSNHPFKFSTTINGTHGGGSQYTTGIGSSSIAPGTAGSYIEIQVDKDTSNYLYYYCSQHAGMGQQGLLTKNDFSNLHFISGSSVSSGSLGRMIVDGKFTLPGISDVSASLAAAIAGGDDLGNHTATQDLNLNTNDLIGTGDITNTGTIAKVSTTHVTASGNISASGDISVDNLTTVGNMTVGGNFTVNGSTTTLSTTNLKVADQFIFTATGSAASNVDGGLIVQSGSAADSGSALYHDKQDERWAIAKGIAADATAVTPTSYVTTVTTANHSPNTTSGSAGEGEMWVDTTLDEIWVRVG